MNDSAAVTSDAGSVRRSSRPQRGCPAGGPLLAYWGFFRVAAAMRKEKALIGYGFSGGVNAAGTQRC